MAGLPAEPQSSGSALSPGPATRAVILCSTAYFLYTAARYCAAASAEALLAGWLHQLAASNVGLTARLAFTLLSAGGVCVVGLVLQRQGTQTQLVMAVFHPRLLSLLTTEQSVDKAKPRAAAVKKVPPPSFKVISSFRLEELEKELESTSSPKAGAPESAPAAQVGEPNTPAARRWSFDFASGGSGAGDSPRALSSCPGSPAKPRTALSPHPGRQRLQRIVSGQRLAELAAEREAKQATESPGGSSGGVPGVSPFAACQHATEQPATEPAEGVVTPAEQAESPGWSAWMEQQSASWSAWASGTLDALLRPLTPGAVVATSALQRTHSAPAGQATWGEAPAPVQAPCCSRGSSHEGAICADPLRRTLLEQLAYAARLQQRGEAAAGGPGHASLSSMGSLPLGGDAGRSALASAGLDADCPPTIRDLIPEEHLIQLGVLAGEQASQLGAVHLGIPPAWGPGSCLFGSSDTDLSDEAHWEQLVEAGEPGLRYEAWRAPLRRGLYVYRSSTVIEGVAPADVRAFHLDDAIRPLWDEAVLDIKRVAPEGWARAPRHSEWCLHRYRSRFPRPMAAREYCYARRVWHRPSDGGCYAICTRCELPPGGDGARCVPVKEFASCVCIRATPGGTGTELVTFYFEDSQVRPSLARMAVPKGLWPFMLKYSGALRVFTDARRAAAASMPASARRRSQDRRRSLDCASPAGAARALVPLEPAASAGSSSDDDELGLACAAALQQRRERGGQQGGKRLKLAHSLVVLTVGLLLSKR